MRFNKLDLNLLVALDHLLPTLRSVSEAGARMNMTQPAMSNALLRLREYFDDDLLVKIGRRLELTRRAVSLRDAVRDVLVRIEWTIATTRAISIRRSSHRQFNVLVSRLHPRDVDPEGFALCRRADATVRFNFLHQVDGPERLLDRGDVDLLIIPKEFCSRRHPFEIILEEQFCAIAWSAGKLAKEKLTRRSFAEASHVVMQPPGGAQSLESVFFKQYDLVRRAEVMTYSFNTMALLVVGTDRIATIHRRLAEQVARLLAIGFPSFHIASRRCSRLFNRTNIGRRTPV